MLLKVDFEKAFDNVNWNFMKYVLKRLGFGEKWLKWIDSCVCNASLSVLVNGSPTHDFPIGKDLRQGDPFSLFLFTLVTEGLAKIVKQVVSIGAFKGFNLNENLGFELLQFEDDTLILCEPS